jgi:hypothetical protein
MAKARNRAVDATLTVPGITRPVGRPRKADALTNAERQKLFRQRNKGAGELVDALVRVCRLELSLHRNGNSFAPGAIRRIRASVVAA